ncbi:hypothetical protein AB0912_22985 [Streptomyces sp. NPDC007084]|uniref:hypothetical protein n=1 Tax=Streptomyces sp. NPDC007084 TaxID=3154313 RepID=UPI003455E1E6
MHHHGYLWTGPKAAFDQEALRRPPHPEPPPPGSRPELIQRHREVAAEFPRCDLPPAETAYWLVKPRSLVRGTWPDPDEAAAWLGRELAAHTPRFAARADRDAGRQAALVASLAGHLRSGGDLALGYYLERPSFLSLALVACSPNRSRPDLRCPLGS